MTAISVNSTVAVRSNRQLPSWLVRAAWLMLLAMLAIPFVLPFVWMVSSSIKSPAAIFAYPPELFPSQPRWQNYIEIFQYQPFARQYFNSLYIAVTTTGLTLLIASLAGYAFARMRFFGDTWMFALLLAAMMMPDEVTLIPNFFLLSSWGATNTHLPVILLPLFGSQGVMATFLMRQTFLGLPKEMEEAARLDGLKSFGIFWQVALPLAKPALAAVAILTFLNSWSLFLEPLIFITDLELFTLPLALTNFQDGGLPVWHLQLAGTTLSVLPVLIVYISAQQQIQESFMMSGVKG